MSETSILPGAAPTTADDPAVPVPPEFDSGEGSDDRRRLMIIGAIIAVVVLAIAAYLLLHKGSSNSGNDGFPPHATPKAVPTAAATGGKHGSGGNHTGGQVVPKTSKRQVVRNPFTPLVAPPAAAGSTQSGPTTTVSPPATVPSSAPTTAPVVIPSSGSTSPSTPTNSKLGNPLWIQLISTSGSRSATFDVGYKHHKFRRFKVPAPSAHATQGVVFDKVFALLGIQNGVVTVQIGDGAPFTLATGVSHSVS